MIYVASSWRNGYQPLVVKCLRAEGLNVYDFKNPRLGDRGFSWDEIDPHFRNWTTRDFVTGLQNPLAESGFQSDFSAMQISNACLLVLPCGRSAHLEAGWFIGQGRTVVIYQPIKQEPELMYKMASLVSDDMDYITDFLKGECHEKDSLV